MKPSQTMVEGWKSMSALFGEEVSSQFGENYLAEIEKYITLLTTDINNSNPMAPDFSNRLYSESEWLKGTIGELHQVDTFNINAAVKGSPLRAIRLASHEADSVDAVIVDPRTLTKEEFLHPELHYEEIVQHKAKIKYQMKVANKPKDAFNMLAQLDSKSGKPRYGDMDSLTSSDTKYALTQTPEGQKYVLRKTHDPRENVAKSSQHVADTLADTMSEDGIHSDPRESKDYKRMSKASRGESEYRPEEDGISLGAKIKAEQLIANALKAGVTAACLTFVLQIGPEIVSLIGELTKNGIIDGEKFKQFGKDALSTTAMSFLEGSVASSLVIATGRGLFGSTAASLSPEVVGCLVPIVLNAAFSTVLFAQGKIDARQMSWSFIDSAVLSLSFLEASKIGGSIAQTLLPQIPGLGFLLGSLIGCGVGVLYHVGKKALISFSKESGFTCFGLVEQDYTLPEEALKDMGIELSDIEYAPIENSTIEMTPIELSKNQPSIKMIRRGVFSLTKIGYYYN